MIQTASNERIVFSHSPLDGPAVLIVCGLHGNETIGVEAAQRLFEKLRSAGHRGMLAVLCGNLPALAKNVRFIDADLNRLWSEAELEHIAEYEQHLEVERRELFACYHALQRFYAEAKGATFVIDLHGTSSKSRPFAIALDREASLAVCSNLSVPVVTWPADRFWDNALVSYTTRCSSTSFAFEVGPLESQQGSLHLEYCLWDALEHTGILSAESSHEVARAREGLMQENRPAIEIVYEHRLQSSRDFRMLPGYTNFQRVRRGDILAYDQGKEITSTIDGYLLFPLYQGVSDYGFSLGRDLELS